MKWIKKPEAGGEESFSRHLETETVVKEVIERVKRDGDSALLELTAKYDGVKLDSVIVDRETIMAAYEKVDRDIVNTVKLAAKNIERFASAQLSALKPIEYESTKGVILGHKLVPVDSVGCYVPAGRYPLPSSALMSIIPAKVAGVKRVAACAPPSADYGSVHPLVLVAMNLAGVDEIYAMGGAQAIAAYRYGTNSLKPTNMIVGPGNRYVVEAKRQLGGEIGIDLLAGPSEVLIIADKTADSGAVAVDLIAKCEHDPDAVAILVTDDESFALKVLQDVEKVIVAVETAEVANISWKRFGEIIVTKNIDVAVDVANERAPEHLQVMVEDEGTIAARLYNYGSLFIGHSAPVAFGDYCSGPNHTLPTNRCARFTGGLWTGSFIKVLSYQKVSQEGAKKLARLCSPLAQSEGLFAHKLSSDLRK